MDVCERSPLPKLNNHNYNHQHCAGRMVLLKCHEGSIDALKAIQPVCTLLVKGSVRESVVLSQVLIRRYVLWLYVLWFWLLLSSFSFSPKLVFDCEFIGWLVGWLVGWMEVFAQCSSAPCPALSPPRTRYQDW
jgi:hypothetical protein